MTTIKYSEKQIDIFNGLIKLMKTGSNPYSIKVSDIAKAANIGKGSIYDHFQSKDEVISQAIIYSIDKEIEYVYSKVQEKESFEEKYYEILRIIIESLEKNLSTINILIYAGGINELYRYLENYNYDLTIYINKINSLFNHILISGLKEEVITKSEDDYYNYMVIHSSIMGFSHYISSKDYYSDTDIEMAMNSSYKLLLKGLN